MAAKMSIWEEIGISSKILNGVPMFGLSSLSPCEAELHELMKQIDMMFQAKKQEWDSVVKNLEDELEVKQKMTSTQMQLQAQLQASLQDRMKENTLLQEQLTALTREKNEIARRFDASVSELRTELQNVKASYDRLLRKHAKRERERGGEQQREADLQRAVSVLRELETEYEAKVRRVKELESDRTRLESEKSALESRVEHLASANGHVAQRLAAHETNEQALRSRFAQYDTELRNVKTENERVLHELERVKDEFRNERTEKERLKQENAMLRGELERAMALAEQTNRKLTAVSSRLDETVACRARVAELEKRVGELGGEVERAVRERGEVSATLRERNAEVEKLLRDRQTERAEREALAKHNNELEHALRERDATMACIRDELSATRSDADVQVRERDAKIAQLIRIAMQTAANDRKRPSCNVSVQADRLDGILRQKTPGRVRVDENNNRNSKSSLKPRTNCDSVDDTLETLPCTNHELSIITSKEAADADADDADADGELSLTSISIDTTMQREHAREQRANSTIAPDWDANTHPSWNEARTHERRRERVTNDTHTRLEDSAPRGSDAAAEVEDLVIGRFMVEEQSRTTHLEALLDSHIEHLRLESDEALQRFVLSTSNQSQLNVSSSASVRQSQGTG